MSRTLRSTAGPAVAKAAIRNLPALAGIGLALLLTGCTSTGRPFVNAGLDRLAVGSIRPVVARLDTTPPVAQSDWEALRRALTSGFLTAHADIDWSNAATGSNGTITPLGTAATRGKVACRAFATTVSDVRGVRRYRGEACRFGDGTWQIGDLTADDAILS